MLSGEFGGAIFTQDQVRKDVHPWQQLIVEVGRDAVSDVCD